MQYLHMSERVKDTGSPLVTFSKEKPHYCENVQALQGR